MKYKFPLGIDNTAPDGEAPEGTVRDALNLLVTAGGGVRSRPTPLLLTSTKALALQGGGEMLQICTTQEWLQLDRAGNTHVVCSIAPATRAVFCAGGDGTLLVTDTGIYQASGRIDWPKPPPPRATGSSGGGLSGGSYKVATAYVSPAGREGPLSWPTTASVPPGGALTVALTPEPGCSTRVYVSAPNGGGLALVGTFTAAEARVTSTPAGRAPVGEDEACMPGGEYATVFAGRLFTALGEFLYFSQPYRYGVMDAFSGYIRLPAPCCGLAALDTQLAVGTSKGMWRLTETDMAQAQLREASVLPVVRGSMVVASGTVLTQFMESPPSELVAAWMTLEGHAVMLPGGQVQKMSGKRLRIAIGSESAGVQFSHQGDAYVAAFLKSPSNLTVGEYL